MDTINQLKKEIRNSNTLINDNNMSLKPMEYSENFEIYILEALVALALGEMRQDNKIFNINNSTNNIGIYKVENGFYATVFIVTLNTSKVYNHIKIFISDFFSYQEIINSVKSQIIKFIKDH